MGGGRNYPREKEEEGQEEHRGQRLLILHRTGLEPPVARVRFTTRESGTCSSVVTRVFHVQMVRGR